MRAAGAQAARDGIPSGRLLQRFTSTTWLVWEAARRIPPPTGRCWRRSARRCCAGIDLLSGAVADGYNAVDRESVARDAEMRRRPCSRISSARLRPTLRGGAAAALADRYGLDPD